MGLDITAYSKLKHIGHHQSGNEDHPWDEIEPAHIEAFCYTGFSAHALFGVPDVKPSALGAAGCFVSGGCFEVTPETESIGFCAGSYSGYSFWRNDLAETYNPYRTEGPPSPEGPFYELLWFADNEGVIATAAAQNLLEDFRAFESNYRLRNVGDDGAYFVQKYLDWKHACELAADGGLIDFH